MDQQTASLIIMFLQRTPITDIERPVRDNLIQAVAAAGYGQARAEGPASPPDRDAAS